jgi:hypothetical protein
VLRQSRYAYACSSEPRGALNPSVSARSRWACLELLRRNDARLEADAKQRFLDGDRSVRFPSGTWKLRRYITAPPI